MHSKVERKEAIRKFRERKPARGTFSLRSTATGRIWVGASRNLDATRNSYWFCLRNGNHPDKALQEEWNAQGEHTFEYEILEILDDELSPIALADVLKEKKGHWVARLDAQPLI